MAVFGGFGKVHKRLWSTHLGSKTLVYLGEEERVFILGMSFGFGLVAVYTGE